MNEIQKAAQALGKQVAGALEKLNASKLERELIGLQAEMTQPDFWKDTSRAQTMTQKEAKLRAQLDPWRQLQREVADIEELSQSGDAALELELTNQLEKAKKTFESLKGELLFSGPYADHDAIVRLHAGAGGTDAQDWADMLLRMYLRWAEKSNMTAEVIERSPSEEAGIKSATISLSGQHAFGKLQGEHGVHRLVRLSPFNADNLRQTSFALVEVLPQIDAPEEVEIDDQDLKIDVFRAGGHGGQSVNTTDSAVRITHIPTGIVVSIQNERSQLQNKETALKVLRSKLAQLQLEQHKERLDDLKGPSKSAEWGNQIRNYVLHPYTLVKDTRTQYEERDTQAVLDGKLDGFITAYLEK